MYAVIKTGGKQYKVAAGEKIKVEQIAADVGQEIVIDQVLAVGNGADLRLPIAQLRQTPYGRTMTQKRETPTVSLPAMRDGGVKVAFGTINGVISLMLGGAGIIDAVIHLH